MTDFSDAAFDEASSVAALEQAGFGLGIAFYRIMKQIAAFIAERYDEALEWADRAAPMLLNVRAYANEATHHFYHALTLAALHAQAPAEQQRQFAQTIAEILEKLKLWADNCPENFANRYFLVSAEMARIEGRDMEAMRLYDQAIRSARDNSLRSPGSRRRRGRLAILPGERVRSVRRRLPSRCSCLLCALGRPRQGAATGAALPATA